MSTGWTLNYVRWHVDLPTLASLSKYWERYPPLQVMVAAYLGVKPESAPNNKTKPSFEDLMAEFPPVSYQPPHLARNFDE